MKKLLSILLPFLLLSAHINAQSTAETPYLQEIRQYQQELNDSYRSPEKSPLEPEDLKEFSGLPFFPIDSGYRIEARFVRTPGSKPFKMPTSTSRLPIYEKYGEAHFELHGQKIVLPLYQSHELRTKAEYKNHLFLPFKDLTNGNESYGGGRYLDVSIPEGDTILLDFNKAYNPYCAYSSRYSCPIPPKENRLRIHIRAGVMASYQD
jgi:uncharacterized protein